MGLRAHFSMDDLGYAESTEELGIMIDYGDGCDIFAETFLSVATSLVPVDTGNLQGSITASSSGDGCDCDASADYAQYVEYGTYKMGAQPYFEPAIAAAYSAAIPYWQAAIQQAQAEEEELLEEMERQQSAKGGRAGGGRNSITRMNYGQLQTAKGMFGGGGGFGSFLGMMLGAIIVGFVQVLLNIATGGSSRGSSRGGGDLEGYGDIEIEIY